MYNVHIHVQEMEYSTKGLLTSCRGQMAALQCGYYLDVVPLGISLSSCSTLAQICAHKSVVICSMCEYSTRVHVHYTHVHVHVLVLQREECHVSKCEVVMQKMVV